MKESVFQRKTELMEAALDEFSVKSYEDASLNTIIRNAGISKGTFYYHFADKKALYLYLLKTSAEVKWKFIDGKASESPGWAACGDIFDRFKEQARLASEFAAKYPRFHRLGEMLSRERGTCVYAEAMEILGGDAQTVIAPMVDRAIREGAFKNEYSREFLIRILSFMFSRFHEIFDREEERAPDRMLGNLDMYVSFIRRGIGSDRGQA